MSIIEKQDPSTATDSDKKLPSGPEFPFIQSDVLPPSYAEITNAKSQSAIASGSGSASPPSSNDIAISRSNQSIDGVWALDTELKIPSDLPAKTPFSLFQSETVRPNLDLFTSNGNIKATVMLVSGSSNRAKIKLGTSNGRIYFQMPSRTKEQPFQVIMRTSNANITVGLPRSYCGPLIFKTCNANVTFSEDLKAVTKMSSSQTAFVGSRKQAGFKDYSSWTSDEVEATTINGNIGFYYSDELEAQKPTVDENVQSVFEGTVKDILEWFGSKLT